MSGGKREGDHVAVGYEAVRRRGVIGSSSGEDIQIGLDVVDGVPGDGHGQRAAFARRRRDERVDWYGDEFGTW